MGEATRDQRPRKLVTPRPGEHAAREAGTYALASFVMVFVGAILAAALFGGEPPASMATLAASAVFIGVFNGGLYFLVYPNVERRRRRRGP